jgi:hypothetical protein
MKLIKINNNNVELAEGVLLVPEFEKLYKDNIIYNIGMQDSKSS